ncbi:hypothetical protein SEUCBS139899_001045 [Sporothrix eucalyptigena]|uniref:Uncharacterized protein n=1 Tax=Sporothrix eucalyptigena TaxID=1812306 RepID=A0ABP0D4X6_9PEZI
MKDSLPSPGGMPNDGARSMLLLGGCYSEAMMANVVAGCVDSLRGFLAEPLRPLMTALSEEMRKCSAVLVRLLEQTRSHPSRVPVLLDYLDLLLPCFQRSLLDIKKYYEDKSKSKEIRWRTMYHKMTEEGGMQLPQRFTLYHQFLLLMSQMLVRSPSFDMNALEVLQNRILQLREKQGIESPGPSGPLVGPKISAAAAFQDKSIHWAEDIFSRPLPSRTPLKHLRFSECFGPFTDVDVPKKARILFRRTFDQERITIFAFIDPMTRSPYLVIRSLDAGSNMPAFSMRGVHEVCIERDGSCLVLKRWSYAERCPKLWAVLYFLTWEELVLFHCTFVAMKFEGDQTSNVNPVEFKIGREKRLFQCAILDDGFKHSLLVYQDTKSRGLRLHANVWDGPLRFCPVWTAFVTSQSRSSSWMVRKNKNRILLHDIQPYVFCNSYRPEHMRQNKYNAFEIEFVAEEAQQRFREIFYPPPTTADSNPTESTASSSDTGGATDTSK